MTDNNKIKKLDPKTSSNIIKFRAWTSNIICTIGAILLLISLVKTAFAILTPLAALGIGGFILIIGGTMLSPEMESNNKE